MGSESDDTSASSKRDTQKPCVLCTKLCSVEAFPKPCSHFEVGEGLGSSCGICQRLDELNGSITELRCTFERDFELALEQRRAYIEEVNHRCDPLQRLPVEVVSSIFTFCLPRHASLDVFDVDEGLRDDYGIHPVQFVLGSICGYWRRVVWSVPQMWNILWVHISHHTTSVRSEILAEWLGRCGTLPLYVSMFHIPDDEDEDEDNLDPQLDAPPWSSITQMIDMLALHICRIRVLHLSLLVPQIELFNSSQPDLPHESVGTTNCHALEKLSIEVLNSYVLEFSSPATFGLNDQILTPTHVSFKNIEPLEIGIWWKDVTWVEAPCIRIEDALMVLTMAPQLQHFKIGDHDDDGYYEDQGIIITHRSLKSLDLTDLSENFLDYIECPGLEELCITSYYYKPHNLRLTPSITHLSLKYGIPDEFLKAFTADVEKGGLAGDNPEGLFLPHLRSFTCTASFEGFQWSKIPSMIRRSRHEKDSVGRPLSEIEIVFDGRAVMEERYAMDRESLIQILDFIRGGEVEVKIKDARGSDLILLSQQFHNIN